MDEEPKEQNIGTVAPRSLETEMEKSYLDYSMSVIVARALPDVRDGLKPVHRRILHVANRMNLTHLAKYRKSATIVGEVMGKYHPHGDQAIYDALARLAQDFSMRYPLVDGQGNFGSMDGDPPAAMRYTEARMTALSEELLADLDKETVDFRPNFDGSEHEPEVLPARVPNLLLNGQVGIAVGMATNIPPHNLTELLDALIYLIETPEPSSDELLNFVKGPDFPTGGVIYGKESIRQAYATGRGGIAVRAVAEVVEGKRGQQIIISEIAYGVNKATMIEKMAELVRDKRINGISDIRDESARGKVRVVIDLKKDAYASKILNQLYKLTPMQVMFHLNMLALVDGLQPRVLNLEGMLKEYLKHRQVVVRRRSEYELRKAREREHVLEGLKLALDDIDAVIKTIRASKSADDAKTNLMNKFKLSEIQSLAILAMQLRTLAGLERQKIEDELKEILQRIKELETILSSEAKVLAVVKDEFIEIKRKYGDERKTKIIGKELGKFSDEELIPNEEVVLTLTKGHYIKRTLLDSYRTQGRGGKGLIGMTTKEEDVIEQLIFTNTHDYILFFTTHGRVFRLKAYDIPSALRNAKGQAIVNILQLHPEERVTSIIKLSGSEQSDFLVMVTKMGVVKKTSLDKFANVRQNGLIAIKLDQNDELRWVRPASAGGEVLVSTAMGQGLRFKEANARPMGRATRGVRGIRLRPKDYVVGMAIVNDDSEILVITENGFGKRTKVKSFTTHQRGGMGIKTNIVTEKTGKTITVLPVDDTEDEVILISMKGNLIRLAIKGISLIGRATQGVRIMKLNKGDRIASAALVKRIKEEEPPAAAPAAKPKSKGGKKK